MVVSNEQFLFSCIEHSNGGSVNWDAVAKECEIPSKGAASIKYRRLKDKFGTASSGSRTTSPTKGGAADEADDGEKKTPKKKTPAKKASPKKRKLDSEDEEETPVVKPEQEDEEV